MSNKGRAWAEINLDAYASNLNEIRDIVGDKVCIMAVVKANAYGHGVEMIAKTAVKNGVTYLGVATFEEAIEIRSYNISIPILVFNHIPVENIKEAIEKNITFTIYGLKYAKQLSEIAKGYKNKARAHIKVDTGMNRIGFKYTNKTEIFNLCSLDNIDYEGIYSHLSCADCEDNEYTISQYSKFMQLVKELEQEGLHFKYKHLCNSAGILRYPELHLDMVRVGIVSYGLTPSTFFEDKINKFKKVMTLKSRVYQIKALAKGEKVGYGGRYITPSKRMIATVSIGYADGYMRGLGLKANVIINDCYAPVVGNICMDQCMVDVTGIGAKEGMEVILIGKSKTKEITSMELADIANTINYEITCAISARIPRIYI